MNVLYRILLWLALPVVCLRLAWRAWRAPGYGVRPLERFGRLARPPPPGTVWVHTVSAGETIAARPIVLGLLGEALGPVLVTTMTATGAERARVQFGNAVHHAWAPWDFPFAVEAFLDAARPRVLVLLETELWPNLLAACRRRSIPVVLANARLSARSAAGYGRLGSLARSMIAGLDAVLCQADEHAARFVALGAVPGRVRVTGSVKFDVAAPDAAAQAFAAARRHEWGAGQRAVWIAASTHAGEERIVLDAHQRLRARGGALADCLLVLVPRHPERFEAVHALAAERFATARRSAPRADAAVIVVDTMGELAGLYGAADIALVGGSLVPVGGHNPIEPLLWGVPVLMGPHRHDVPDISAAFAAAGALREVDGADGLAAALAGWFDAPADRARAGAAGQAVIAASRGATAGVLQAVRAAWGRSGAPR